VISEPEYSSQQPRRRWERVSWWYSLILVIPILGFLITAAFQSVGGNDENHPSGVVRDAYTGDPVSGAEISASGLTSTSNGNGEFRLPDPEADQISVSREDYEPTQVTVTPGTERVDVELRPTTLQGVVTNERTGNAVEGAIVTAAGDGDAAVTAVTDSDGKYVLKNVPRNATVSVEYDGFTSATSSVGQQLELDFVIRTDALTGRITDQDGNPLEDVSVQIGTSIAITDADGSYRLNGVPSEGIVVAKKSGYREATSELPEDMRFDAQLERFIVRSLYATALTVAHGPSWNGLLEIADTTEINAMVVDLKDSSGRVFYDTEVQLAHDIGAVHPILDPQQTLEDLHSRGMYSIARIVVFEDPILADQRRDLAIRDSTTGGVWVTWDGLAWVNAHQREVWEYNIALAVEAAEMGFDEIQLDYIRFPTDGVLATADYGTTFAGESASDAITEFLRQMRDALAPTGAYLAVDIFGFTLWEESDGGIGQQLERIEPYVDVINPMIYPSHFHPGAMGFDIPNNHPYEVILWSLQSGAERIGDKSHKFRPWLQDFSYGEGIQYGPDQLRAQIQASEDFGASGWLVWNAANVFSVEAFAPAD
jgi:hypothetical protein